MVKIFGLIILLVLFSGFCGKPAEKPGEKPVTPDAKPSVEKPVVPDAKPYGEKVKFSQNQPVKFADFNLTYAGKRVVPIEKPVFRQFTYYDFKAETASGEQQTVSWSSGLGEIAPAPFEIGGEKYELEFSTSLKLGDLADDEIVVWKK